MGTEEKRKCSKCGETKLLQDFHKNRANVGGLRYECKACHKAYQKRYNKSAKGAEIKKNNERKLRYGVDNAWVEEQKARQGGICPICEMDLDKPRGERGFCIDHDHDTGEIRGLLCNSCNRGLGFLSDNPDRTHRATKYLDDNKARGDNYGLAANSSEPILGFRTGGQGITNRQGSTTAPGGRAQHRKCVSSNRGKTFI